MSKDLNNFEKEIDNQAKERYNYDKRIHDFSKRIVELCGLTKEQIAAMHRYQLAITIGDYYIHPEVVPLPTIYDNPGVLLVSTDSKGHVTPAEDEWEFFKALKDYKKTDDYITIMVHIEKQTKKSVSHDERLEKLSKKVIEACRINEKKIEVMGRLKLAVPIREYTITAEHIPIYGTHKTLLIPSYADGTIVTIEEEEEFFDIVLDYMTADISIESKVKGGALLLEGGKDDSL